MRFSKLSKKVSKQIYNVYTARDHQSFLARETAYLFQRRRDAVVGLTAVGRSIGGHGAARPARTTGDQLRIVAKHESLVDAARHDVVRTQQDNEHEHQYDEQDDETDRQVELRATELDLHRLPPGSVVKRRTTGLSVIQA